MGLRTRLWCFVGWCLFARSALAQTTEEELALANRTAMEAFSRLEVAEARAQLEFAVQNARAAGLRSPTLARTFVSLGVVCVAGLNDSAAGLVAFKQAIDLDPNVEVDPLFNTPNIDEVFVLAMGASEKAAQRAAAGQPAVETPPAPAQPAIQPPTSPVRFESTLLHAPALEQLTQTAVPVYVANAELNAEKMRLSYRTLGMRTPKTAEMQRTKDGFAFLIPCSQVFEPRVAYWIEALDGRGQQVGFAGTADNPIVIPIVTTRSRPAPNLPGQPAPAQCGTHECPPGMPGCQDVGNGSAGLGDTCRTDGDCGAGLACRDDFCSVENAGTRGGARAGADRARFFVEAGFSLGLATIETGHAADSPPPARVTREAIKLQVPQQLPYIRNQGWACKSRSSQRDIDGDGMPEQTTELYDCNVNVTGGFVVPTLAIHLSAGYRFNDKLYAAAMTRIQLDRGTGTLAGLLLGARGGYVLIDQGAKGFAADVFGGIGVGQIQPQVLKNGPYALSGLAAFEFGGQAAYRVSERVALMLSPHAFVMLPTFLFNLDITGGAQLTF